MVAVVLFSLGGLFSIYEGYHKLREPEDITSPAVAFAIFGLAIVFEAFALRTAVRHAQPERRGRTWVSYIRTSRSPELPVLLLEDSGALLGLVFATAGVALAIITGNPVFDALGTLAIGVLLVGIAIVLAIEMKSLLIGEAASGPRCCVSMRITRRTSGLSPSSASMRSIVSGDGDLPGARPARDRERRPGRRSRAPRSVIDRPRRGEPTTARPVCGRRRSPVRSARRRRAEPRR